MPNVNFQRVSPGSLPSAEDYNRLCEEVERLSRLTVTPPLDMHHGDNPAIRLVLPETTAPPTVSDQFWINLTNKYIKPANFGVITGGAGYSIGDVLTLSANGVIQTSQVKVTSVSGTGAITGIQMTAAGLYQESLGTLGTVPVLPGTFHQIAGPGNGTATFQPSWLKWIYSWQKMTDPDANGFLTPANPPVFGYAAPGLGTPVQPAYEANNNEVRFGTAGWNVLATQYSTGELEFETQRWLSWLYGNSSPGGAAGSSTTLNPFGILQIDWTTGLGLDFLANQISGQQGDNRLGPFPVNGVLVGFPADPNHMGMVTANTGPPSNGSQQFSGEKTFQNVTTLTGSPSAAAPSESRNVPQNLHLDTRYNVAVGSPFGSGSAGTYYATGLSPGFESTAYEGYFEGVGGGFPSGTSPYWWVGLFCGHANATYPDLSDPATHTWFRQIPSVRFTAAADNTLTGPADPIFGSGIAVFEIAWKSPAGVMPCFFAINGVLGKTVVISYTKPGGATGTLTFTGGLLIGFT